MAKPPAAPSAEPTAKSGGGKKLLIIIVILLLVVLIAVAGFVALLLLKKGGGDSETATLDTPVAVAPAVPVTGINLDAPPTFVSLEPFVVNLRSGEGERFLRAVISLRVADARTAEGLKGFMPEIRHRVNLLLSGKLPSEVGSTEGRQQLARDIADEVNQVLGLPPGMSTENAPVRAVLFDQFIIQ